MAENSSLDISLDNCPEYMHYWELKGKPLIVMLCAHDPIKRRESQEKTSRRERKIHGCERRVLEEDEFFRRNYHVIEFNGDGNNEWIAILSKYVQKSHKPWQGPVLVCGFIRECAVRDFRNALVNQGYEAYICLEGSYELKLRDPPKEKQYEHSRL